MLLTVFMYLAFTAFAGFSLHKVYQYAQNPLNNRWELYPAPKEPLPKNIKNIFGRKKDFKWQ